MDELVIVIADLYLPEEGPPAVRRLPGLERIARFARGSTLTDGWRPWLARRMGSQRLAEEAPACVAARCADAQGADAVWLATPVHCVAGLCSLHLDHHGLLKLPAAQLESLAEDFRNRFQGSGFALEPLASGVFLLAGPALSDAAGTEPALALGQLAAALPRAPALRRLGTEIEIWLHEHAVNRARTARGEPPVTALWIWGGGARRRATATPAVESALGLERAYGRDPYLDGLWCARGARVEPLPASIEEVLAGPARRSVIVVELSEQLVAAPTADLGDALAALDARWLAPAAQLVARGAVRRLAVLANGRCLLLARHDRLRRWRRTRPGLAGLV